MTSKNLIEEIRQITNSHKDGKQSAEREKASNDLFEQLKQMIPDKVRTYAGYGRTEARILDFKISDNYKIGDFFAKDLLSKGNIITHLQEYMDKEHSDGSGASFYVYFTRIGMRQETRENDKYGVFINWDKKSWDTIRQRINHNTYDHTGKQHNNSRGFKYSNGGRPSIGRPPYNNNNNDNDDIDSIIPMFHEESDKPKKKPQSPQSKITIMTKKEKLKKPIIKPKFEEKETNENKNDEPIKEEPEKETNENKNEEHIKKEPEKEPVEETKEKNEETTKE